MVERSFRGKTERRRVTNLWRREELDPVKRISSTYIGRITILLEKKKLVSIMKFIKSLCNSQEQAWGNYVRGACLKSYRDFLRWHTYQVVVDSQSQVVVS